MKISIIILTAALGFSYLHSGKPEHPNRCLTAALKEIRRKRVQQITHLKDREQLLNALGAHNNNNNNNKEQTYSIKQNVVDIFATNYTTFREKERSSS